MHAAVSSKRDTLADLCQRFHVKRLEVSALKPLVPPSDPGA
jgi:hypothetical protein